MDYHYTREDVVNRDFLFVSYKHDDKSTVMEVLEFLLEQGVRLWYDTDLVVGDKWSEIAKGLIQHENCKGVIFFNSINSFKSNPVFLERGFVKEKIEENKNSGTPFLIFPVNIGKASTMRLLKSVFDSLPDDDVSIEREFPIKYLQGICELFDSDTIYCYADPQNSEQYKQMLLDNIMKALPSVVDEAVLNAIKVEKTLGKVQKSISFGTCKGRAVENLPSYLLMKDQRVDYQGATYIVESGVAYETKAINWRVVDISENSFTLISENVVDVRNGGDQLNEWLSTTFTATAFNEEERKGITGVRLLSEKDIALSKTKNLLVFDNEDAHWWLNSKSMGALQKVVKKDGSIYNSGYNYRTKKSGVRPVVTITKDCLSAITK